MTKKDQPKSKKQLIIIGGGASGLIAAHAAAKAGADVIVLEKMTKCALKVGISGKGRANITNDIPVHEFTSKYPAGGKFLRSSFSRFFVADTIDMFDKLGVPCTVGQGNRVFPESEKAHDVRTALVKLAKKSGATIYDQALVKSVKFSDGLFHIKTDGWDFDCEKLIIATGGLSYPQTGSSGDGLSFAKNLGHTVIDCRPALVYLKVAGNEFSSFAGRTLKNIEFAIKSGEKDLDRKRGELVFEKEGIGGAIPISMARLVADSKADAAEIDFKPALSHKKLDARLLREFQSHTRPISATLKTLLPEWIVAEFLFAVGIDGSTPSSQISKEQRKKIRLKLKGWRFKIEGPGPIERGIVTAGGVDLRQINKKTLESKLIPGLYFCGEVLDIDGVTGGFNLQAAFSTGFVAGTFAASSIGTSDDK